MNQHSKACFTAEQLQEFLAADEGELYSMLGTLAIASGTPIDLLEAGRAGKLYQAPPTVLGSGQRPFKHSGLEQLGKAFLAKWATQLRKAICENDHLLKEEKARGKREVDVLIATIVASITSNIPELQQFSVLLNVLAVIIVRSGVNAFCQDLS